jgi:flagellar motility protein MotE (MotC chaperone)
MSMMRFVRDLRLIPIALIASACLLALKTADLALDGGRWLAGDSAPADGGSLVRVAPDATDPLGQNQSWAHQMFNFPGSGGAASAANALGPSAAERAKLARATAEGGNGDITGSISDAPTPPAANAAAPGGALAAAAPNTKPAAGAPGAKPAAGAPGAKAAQPPPPIDGTLIPLDGPALPSGAERAILERLQQRREELDARARELDIRENLIKAAEQRIDAHLAEVKEVESRIKVETDAKDQAEVARFKNLVTMYENMKARDAAKIFNRLDMDVLIKVASQINPRSMADIMAQMTPDVADRLTVELASKAEGPTKNAPAELPKIEGRPTGQ